MADRSVSSAQLLAVAGKKSPSTLRRWLNEGLLTEEMVERPPAGRRPRFWNGLALSRCQLIAALEAKNYSYEAIREYLALMKKLDRRKWLFPLVFGAGFFGCIAFQAIVRVW